jgi:hypothetical protein
MVGEGWLFSLHHRLTASTHVSANPSTVRFYFRGNPKALLQAKATCHCKKEAY